jgi:hypothetical protein
MVRLFGEGDDEGRRGLVSKRKGREGQRNARKMPFAGLCVETYYWIAITAFVLFVPLVHQY